MRNSGSYEIPVAAGKQISSLTVFKDGQDRELLIVFSDGTELTISMEVRSVTSAIHYQPTGYVPETLARFDEPPSETGIYGAVIRASKAPLK